MADISDRLDYGGERGLALGTGGGRASWPGPPAGGGVFCLLDLPGEPGGLGIGEFAGLGAGCSQEVCVESLGARDSYDQPFRVLCA